MLIKAKTLTVETTTKVQIFDLTRDVKTFVAETGVWNGQGVISTLHTT
ncbi:MAG: YjbQ family protein, partial [Deltaproteobacteria bacterium]|nr:YjbQ family protein [Deltaproteobacteria bacterium]